jgi:hydroxymethylbilane synthase
VSPRGAYVIGSRGSQLALWQSNYVKGLIEQATGIEVSIKRIRTTGDKITDVPLARVGAKGLFVKEIEVALARGDVDLAVHSMKDVPTMIPEGLEIAGTTERADPRDVLVGAHGVGLADLKLGARVGTSSLRRRAQLAAIRGDLDIVDQRGNLDTRVGRVKAGHLDAIILAAAGIDRLGWSEVITERIDPLVMVPAVGQGAIAIEIRADDREMRAALATFCHAPTLACVTAERVVMRELEGGCQVPIGANARISAEDMVLDALVASLDGAQLLRTHVEGPADDPEALGHRAVTELLAQGALEILAVVRAEAEVMLDAGKDEPRWSGTAQTALPASEPEGE